MFEAAQAEAEAYEDYMRGAVKPLFFLPFAIDIHSILCYTNIRRAARRGRRRESTHQVSLH